MASIRDLLSPTNNHNSTESGGKERDEDSRVDDGPETTHFTVEFILDMVCPYCYVGYKNLNTAIRTYTARHPEASFLVTCSPFLLDPIAGRSAYDKPDYPIIRAHSIDYWKALGESIGLEFSFKGRMGNTRDAHKLLRFALERTPTTAPSTAFAARISTQNQRVATYPPGPLEAAAVLRARAEAAGGGRASSATATAEGEGGGDGSDNTTSNSVANHLPPLARGPTLQLRVLEALFRTHHESDGDISDRTVLVKTGMAAMAGTGISETEIRGMLEESDSETDSDGNNEDSDQEMADQGAKEAQGEGNEGQNTESGSRRRLTWGRAVDALFAEATSPNGGRGLAVRAVPTLVVNDRYVVGGAQSAAFLVAMFEKIRTGGGAQDSGDGDGNAYYT